MHVHPETRPTSAGPPAWAIAAPWLACGVIATSQAYFLWPPASGPDLVRALEGQLPPWLYLAAVAPLVVRIARRYPLTRETWKTAIRPHILANLLIAAGYAWIVSLSAYGIGETYFVQNPLYVAFGRVLAKSIHIELFTSPVTAEAKREVAHATTAAFTGQAEVVVRLDGREQVLHMTAKGDPVLDAAIDAGMDVPYACKGAVCCTCKARVVEGQVEMDMNYALTDEEVAQGYVLTCQTHPRSARVVIDYDQH